MVDAPDPARGLRPQGGRLWGILQPGAVQGYSLRRFPLPLALPRGKLSGSERRSRGNATIASTPSARSATGRQLQESQKNPACPKARQNWSRHRYADPRRAEGHCTGARLKRFFLLDRPRPVLFLSRTKREWGWNEPAGAPAESPGRQIAAPTASRGCPHQYSRWFSRPHSRLLLSRMWAFTASSSISVRTRSRIKILPLIIVVWH